MAEMLADYYTDLYEMNIKLLNMVREEQWDEFTVLVKQYEMKMVNSPEGGLDDTLSLSEKDLIRGVITNIVDNSAEISRIVSAQINTLKQNISSLHLGARMSQIYHR